MSSPIEATCNCGQKVLVEANSNRTCRTDRKRIYYPDEADIGACIFRCKRCHEPISETCRAAQYGERLGFFIACLYMAAQFALVCSAFSGGCWE